MLKWGASHLQLIDIFFVITDEKKPTKNNLKKKCFNRIFKLFTKKQTSDVS